MMLLRTFTVALLLSASPALAFDTSRLGQRGSLPLSDLTKLISKSARLQKEVKETLAAGNKKIDDVICDGMRFPGEWVNLGGERVAPYNCDFGSKWLIIDAKVKLTDSKAHVFEKSTPTAMKKAAKIEQTNLTWKWTTEAPYKED
jgi:hypothetical protein